MRTRSWTWWLGFTKLLTCLALITSLWGCAAPMEHLPSSVVLSSVQARTTAEREALPDELRGKRIARKSLDLHAMELRASLVIRAQGR